MAQAIDLKENVSSIHPIIRCHSMKHDLNPKQHAAVRYIDGPLLVLAGAGSGKTRVITQKIVYLIKECGLTAQHIAAVTFTNKAAREMKHRIGQELNKKQLRGLQISTFHTLGLKVIKSEFKKLGYKKDLSIYDSQDCLAILKELCNSFDIEDSLLKSLQSYISKWKNALVLPEEVLNIAGLEQEEIVAAELYSKYRKYLKSCNAVDFDDLILLPVKLFQDQPECLEKWQNRLRYILVDEYQDTNVSQYRLIQQLVGARTALTVVGDDDQSIYAWRGAEAKNLARLSDDYPKLKVIKLEQNYRSTGCILQAANGIIANNPHVFEKKLWSEMGFGEQIRIVETRNEDHEAERVISEIVQHRFQNKTNNRDYAILYRGNHQSRILERQLREQQIPYRISGGSSFFAYAEVKDIIAYLRLVSNPDDNAAFIRVVNTPRRGIGSSTLEKLMQYAEEREISFSDASRELGLEQIISARAIKPLRYFSQWLDGMTRRADDGELLSLVNDIISSIEYADWLDDISNDQRAAERKMANVTELVDWISQVAASSNKDKSLSEIVAHMQLMDILERHEQEEELDVVSLMTLHAAKGLEFPYVYIVGFEEEILPHHSSIDDGNVEEERRLAYVGVTRAQRELTIIYAAKRKRAGEMVDSEPSRFLTELPEQTYQWRRLNDKVDPEQRQENGKAHLSALRGILSEQSVS